MGGLEELLIASRVEFWYANLGIFFQYRVAVVLYFFWFYIGLILVKRLSYGCHSGPILIWYDLAFYFQKGFEHIVRLT